MKKKVNLKSIIYKASAVTLSAAVIMSCGFSAVGTYTEFSPTVNAAQTKYESGDYTYTVNDYGTVTINEYNGDDKEVVVPSTIDGKAVSEIGFSAFLRKQNITKIIIPDSVTTIDSFSIWNCESLTSVNIPVNVKEIGRGTFAGCSSIKEFTVDENNKYFTSDDGIIFSKDKKQLVRFPIAKDDVPVYKIPEYVESIAPTAFMSCTYVTEVFIPDSFTEIGNQAFSSCTSLKSIHIPDSVTAIGENAFSETGLESIEFSDSITSLGEKAFLNCNYLTEITLPKNVSEIPYYAFAGCHNAKNIVIPEGVKILGRAVFENCTSLESVTIPMSLETVSYAAFLINGSKFKSIYYPGTKEDFEKITVEAKNSYFDIKKLKKLEQTSTAEPESQEPEIQESAISETLSSAVTENDNSVASSKSDVSQNTVSQTDVSQIENIDKNNNSNILLFGIAGVAVIGVGAAVFLIKKKR